MTLSDLVSDLENRVGPGVEIDGTGLTRWINDSYMYMVDRVAQGNPNYFTDYATADVEGSQQEYALPTDSERVVMVNINYGDGFVRAKPIQHVNDIRALADSTDHGHTQSDPRFYIYGTQIGFLPIPDTDVEEGIKIWDVYTPSELSSTNTTPALPAKFHSLINLGAYATYLDQNDEHNAAELIRRRFESRVDEMVESLNESQIDQPKTISIIDNIDLYTEQDLIY